MKFRLVNRVPVVEENGVSYFYDTGLPCADMPVKAGIQQFFGIPGLHAKGVAALKRYTKIDYANSEIVTSDNPIPLAGGKTVPLEVRPSGWLVKMTVGGAEGLRYIDTGSAYSYVPGVWEEFDSAGIVNDCGFSGRPWMTDAHKIPCTFDGHDFNALCGKVLDNLQYVPPEGVIGYDFLENFKVVVDRVAGKMIYKRNKKTNSASDAGGHIRPNLKVGELARLAFSTYFQSADCDQNEVARLQDGAYCQQTFSLLSNLPVLKRADEIANAPEVQGTVGSADLQNHYYVHEYVIAGARYRLTNNWKESSARQPCDNRTPLEDWIRRMGMEF